jgi:hypothetical protein
MQGGLQVRGEEGGTCTLAGDVGHGNEQVGVAEGQGIVIIAADEAKGRVVSSQLDARYAREQGRE